jgi:mandelamide amidase
MYMGLFTARQYVDALIENVEKNTDLNAFITFDPDRIRREADAADERWMDSPEPGRLNGIPIMIKDNIDVEGYPTTAGTPALTENIPSQNAPIVQTLIDQGAIVFGKTNMDELASGISSNNRFFGAVLNPYDKTRIAGGSSGGNAAGLVALFAPAAVGTDTAGSVRIPASLTGTVGYRPSAERYPQEGVVPLSFTYDTTGIMARTVRDVILVDRVIMGQSWQFAFRPVDLEALRLGVDRNIFFRNLEPETERVVSEALRKLEERGVELVDVSLPNLFRVNEQISFPVSIYETMIGIPEYLQEGGGDITLDQVIEEVATSHIQRTLRDFWSGKESISERTYREAMETIRPQLQKIYEETFVENNIDALIFPTTPSPAVPFDLPEEKQSVMRDFNKFTDPGSNAGIPGVSLNAGFTSEGLPIGIEIDGPYDSDDHLLSIALSLENVFSHGQHR